MSDSGTLPAKSLHECVHLCKATCKRCAYISFSVKNADCSWYVACDLEDLRRPPISAGDYVSLKVRQRAIPPPARLWSHLSKPLRPALSIAIATTTAPSAKAACALLQWCERAALFARSLRANGWSTDVLLLVEPAMLALRQASAACPGATHVEIEARLVRMVRACEQKTPITGDGHPSRMMPILKWAAVQLTRYEFVLFADSDVSLVPEGGLARTAARWAQMAPPLRNVSWPELLSHADSMSPMNGGVWLVRPSAARYATGLRVLHRCKFNSSHGWDHVGPPRSLGLAFKHADGTRVSDDTGDPPWQSDAYRRDDWAFVGADSDQGFFFYVKLQRAEGRFFAESWQPLLLLRLLLLLLLLLLLNTAHYHRPALRRSTMYFLGRAPTFDGSPIRIAVDPSSPQPHAPSAPERDSNAYSRAGKVYRPKSPALASATHPSPRDVDSRVCPLPLSLSLSLFLCFSPSLSFFPLSLSLSLSLSLFSLSLTCF